MPKPKSRNRSQRSAQQQAAVRLVQTVAHLIAIFSPRLAPGEWLQLPTCATMSHALKAVQEHRARLNADAPAATF